MLYKDCEAMWFFLDNDDLGQQRCEVLFKDKNIVVDFFDNGRFGSALWRGEENGNGHYQLRLEGGDYGVAGLHRFDGGNFLDGYWEQDDADGTRGKGMVRITLSDPVKIKKKK